MAKGQKRSNREIKKPKQERKDPKVESPMGGLMKGATGVPPARGKR